MIRPPLGDQCFFARILAAAGRMLRRKVSCEVFVLTQLLGDGETNRGVRAHLSDDQGGHFRVVAKRMSVNGLRDRFRFSLNGRGGEHRAGEANGEKWEYKFFHRWWWFFRGAIWL